MHGVLPLLLPAQSQTPYTSAPAERCLLPQSLRRGWGKDAGFHWIWSGEDPADAHPLAQGDSWAEATDHLSI